MAFWSSGSIATAVALGACGLAVIVCAIVWGSRVRDAGQPDHHISSTVTLHGDQGRPVMVALDPDGHCIQLYYYMEQIGWDGRARPAAERRRVNGNWPEALEPLSDTYVDQIFQGPLG